MTCGTPLYSYQLEQAMPLHAGVSLAGFQEMWVQG